MAAHEINGTRVEVVERGSGEPLVLVHGSASDHRTWETTLDAFSDRYRTIAYSRRYHWPNEKIPEHADYSMLEHVEDLAALLAAVDAGPVHLIGHSYGGFVSLLFALREPGKIRSLVLAEPPVVPLFISNPPKPLELLALLLRRPRTAAAILQFGRKGIVPATAAARRGDMDAAMRIFGNAVLGEEFFARMPSTRWNQVRANAFQAEFLGSGFPPVDVGRLRELRVPTLLVCGEKSPPIFPRLSDRLEELLPVVRRVEIPGASHAVHEDDPAAFHAAVGAFLASHRAV